MFAAIGGATRTAHRPDSPVQLSLRAIRKIEELVRAPLFPFVTALVRIGVKSALPIKEIVDVHDNRDRGKRTQRIDDLLPGVGCAYQVRVHFVIGCALSPGRGKALRRCALSEHAGWKDVGMGVDICGNESEFQRHSPDGGGAIDCKRAVVEYAVARGRLAPI